MCIYFQVLSKNNNLMPLKNGALSDHPSHPCSGPALCTNNNINRFIFMEIIASCFKLGDFIVIIIESLF